MHSGVTGEPASVTPCSVDSLNLSLGTKPPFSSAATYVGLVPNSEAPESSTIFHRTSGLGQAGLPSYSTGTTSDSRELTRKFHIIQPVVVKKNNRSPGCTSKLNLRCFSCSRTMPPWLWQMGFGRPVVPEENRIHNGCSNGTCANSNSPAGTGGCWKSSSHR